ncbi:Protein FAR1-RELATED SEQUENCE 5 [Morella rubra]|uniref:Protein FAR1-RELATED SEQUENCE 5 n=1 Tax=Morella rubra TaxID=262757 RepID=A0A6A1WPW1_9ROSI|nr:Protein FAR1-RELATED SEQUENCE 5 [Morella rubra]
MDTRLSLGGDKIYGNELPPKAISSKVFSSETHMGKTEKLDILVQEVDNAAIEVVFVQIQVIWFGQTMGVTNIWTLEWRDESMLMIGTMRTQLAFLASVGIRYKNKDKASIRPKIAHNLMVAQAGGRVKLGFTQTDLKNYLSNKRSKSVEVGVASALFNWFGDQYQKNSQFFFKIMFDDDEQITNVFWSDHDMRNDYALLGNFVSFDTT